VAAAIADRIPTRYSSLADQVRRASIAIPLNIAEGSGKSTGPDQRRFYAVARGSAMECAAIVDACRALELVAVAQAADADALLAPVIRVLSKMCRMQETPVQVQV
jgi:four helix bundle protein